MKNLQGVAIDFYWIMLNPAWLGVYLAVFQLCRRDDIGGLVEDQAARTGSVLINGSNIFHFLLSV